MGGLIGMAVKGYKAYKNRKDDKKLSAGMDRTPAASDGGSGSDGVDSYKRGGRVRRTGLARVHKGERVLTIKQAGRMRRKSKSRR